MCDFSSPCFLRYKKKKESYFSVRWLRVCNREGHLICRHFVIYFIRISSQWAAEWRRFATGMHMSYFILSTKIDWKLNSSMSSIRCRRHAYLVSWHHRKDETKRHLGLCALRAFLVREIRVKGKVNMNTILLSIYVGKNKFKLPNEVHSPYAMGMALNENSPWIKQITARSKSDQFVLVFCGFRIICPSLADGMT